MQRIGNGSRLSPQAVLGWEREILDVMLDFFWMAVLILRIILNIKYIQT